MIKKNNIIIYFKKVTRKMNKYIEDKSGRNYKKEKTRTQPFKKYYLKQPFIKHQKLLKKACLSNDQLSFSASKKTKN